MARFFLSISVVTVFLFYWSSAQAACSRDDVDYYLEKGFTQAQVSAICSGGTQSSQPYRPAGKEEKAAAEAKEKEKQLEADIRFLELAIKGVDVVVTPKKLEYTRKFCVATGIEPTVEARIKTCPYVRYRIYFKGLEVLGVQRKYIFLGTRELEVKGKVKRKLLDNLKDYPVPVRRDLLAAYKNRTREGGTYIPIRQDIPMNRVEVILNKYARAASRK